MPVPAVALAALALAPLGLTDCRPVEGFTQCSGLVDTWDGVPLDTTVTLPAGAGRGGLPLVVNVHGFGNSKHEYLDPASRAYTDNVYGWARDGYAVLTITARGLWGSCGTPESRAARPDACARGYLRLADVRYEVRDTQELVGRLVDEGVADPDRIGVTGDSYGGGQTLMLAALRDRVMQPDGTLVPWRSPRGRALSVRAAAPVIPWTHLIGAIAPNGRTRSETVTPAGAEIEPVGVFKLSVANAILAAASLAIGPGQPVGEPFVPGRPEGYVAPPGLDPEADVAGWVTRANAGEPYDDAQAAAIVDTLVRFHSPYGIDASRPPPPLFIGTGFTDDLFPADEVLRFVHRTRRDHPSVPVSVLLGDFGHQRAANKPADRERLVQAIHAFFAHHLLGRGAAPASGFEARTQVCPRDRPSEGPCLSSTFSGLAGDELRFASDAPQAISSSGGDPQTAAAIDPAAGGGDGCVVVPARRAPGTAVYDLPAATGAGVLLLGAPAITASLRVSGEPRGAQVQARLWDVAPDGSGRRLIARGTYRPSGGESDSWELHPNAWRFEAGHVPQLELLGVDAPYGRPSNAAFEIAVERLALRLPVRGSARRCVSRRRFTVRVPRGARVTVAGRRVPVRRGRAVVDLRGRPRGTFRVRITYRTKAGRRITLTRRYRTCAPR